MSKIILSAVIIVAVTSTAFARGRTLPAGPEDYIDDNGFWHSIYSDWPLQRADVSGLSRSQPRDSRTTEPACGMDKQHSSDRNQSNRSQCACWFLRHSYPQRLLFLPHGT